MLHVIETLSSDDLHAKASLLTHTPAVLALLSLTPSLPPARACAICDAFLQHADASIRAESLRIRESLHTLSDDLIARALRDPADSVASQAIQVLRARETAGAAADTLAAYLTPTEANPVAISPRFDLIAIALVGLGDSGISTAAATLDALTRSLDAHRATLADRLASHLRPHADHPDAARALKRYRRSLTRLIAFFAPGAPAAQATHRRHAA